MIEQQIFNDPSHEPHLSKVYHFGVTFSTLQNNFTYLLPVVLSFFYGKEVLWVEAENGNGRELGIANCNTVVLEVHREVKEGHENMIRLHILLGDSLELAATIPPNFV